MENADYRTTFLNYLQYEKRYSPHTISSYLSDFDQYSQFLASSHSPVSVHEAGHLRLRSWVVHLVQNGISPRSVHRKISSVKAYYRLLLRLNKISVNPAAKISLPRQGKRLPHFIPEQHMEFLFEKVEYGDGYPGLRNRVVVELLYHTGMRRAELMNMKIEDMDLPRNQIRVLGKGRKIRILPILPEMSTLLKTYLKERSTTFPDTPLDLVFLTDKGESPYPKMIYNIVHQYLSLATSVEKRSPHVLRHSFATHLANRGAELQAIKELLGHANLSATQIYTHTSIERLKEVYQKAHPKGKK